MKLQLSVCDTVLEIRQDSTLSIFLQLNAILHNAKRAEQNTSEFSVFKLTFPNSASAWIRSIIFINKPEGGRKILQDRYRA